MRLCKGMLAGIIGGVDRSLREFAGGKPVSGR